MVRGLSEMKHILVVEDERPWRAELQTRLKAKGYDVDFAWDYDSAKDKAIKGKDKYQVVIMDLKLNSKASNQKEFKGIDLIRDLQQLTGRNQYKFVVFSGHTLEYDTRVIVRKYGATSIINKPTRNQPKFFEELYAAIEALIDSTPVIRGPVEVDFYKEIVIASGQEVQLTKHEYLAFSYIFREKNASVYELIEHVYYTDTGDLEDNDLRKKKQNMQKVVSSARKKLRNILGGSTAPITCRNSRYQLVWPSVNR